MSSASASGTASDGSPIAGAPNSVVALPFTRLVILNPEASLGGVSFSAAGATTAA